MDNPVPASTLSARRDTVFVVLAAAFTSLCAFLYYFTRGQILLYGDSVAHINIARRVFDYWLLGQYPNDEDMAAVKKGQAGTPIGKPRIAADMPWSGAP